MIAFNEKLIKKSYMLEFYSSNAITPDEAILFSVPPQNETFRHHQRINKTPTFGGTIIDDYGNDLIEIRLSGSTINQDLRIVYSLTEQISSKTGSQEIEKIESVITKFGETANLKDKKVLLYSLDGAKLNKCWQVAIETFDIKRSKENPFAYQYDLVCYGYYPKDKNRSAALQNFENLNISDKVKNLESTIDKIHSKISGFEKVIAVVAEGADKFRKGLDYIHRIEDEIKYIDKLAAGFSNAIASYIDVVDEYFNEGVYFGDLIVQSALRNTLGISFNIYESMTNLANDIIDFADYSVNFINDSINKGFFQTLANDYINDYVASTEEVYDNWISFYNDLMDLGNEGVVVAESISKNTEFIVVPGDKNTDDQIVMVYGYTITTVKDNDTWETLANKYLGNPDYARLLASYNFDVDLAVGIQIRIPDLTGAKSSNLNFYGANDNYGKDIFIYNNDFAVKNNDLVAVEFINNLNQAIENRLSTARDARIRLALYGINAQVGNAQYSQSYIMSSIEETVLADPRVKSVDKIYFEGTGNNINIKVDYTDVNGIKNNFAGVI